MILDSLLKVSANQQITADAVSTNTIDSAPPSSSPFRNMQVGEPMAFMVAIKAVGTTTGSSKLQAIMSAAANLGSPTIIGEIDLATADITPAGKIYIVPCGWGLAAQRYLGMNHDITGTVDYTVDAYYGPWSQMSALAVIYAKGYTIS